MTLELHHLNRNPVVFGDKIEQPTQETVKTTPSLWQADLDTAIQYGGELTRAALGAMNIRGDKKYVLVDTKVHMLMPGQCPAIPGWHTDGAPRFDPKTGGYSPLGKGPADLSIQEKWEQEGDTPRFHLLVTGEGCLTEFVKYPFTFPHEPAENLYKNLSRFVESFRGVNSNEFFFSPSCQVLEWDWWSVHQGVLATKREFRFLIRVTESNYHEPLPRNKLHEIIRTQQMVYTPMEFGW